MGPWTSSAAPADPFIGPRYQVVRAVTIRAIVSSLLALGAGIANMTSTIDEIGKINSEIVDTRRKFRWHWKVLDFHVELSNRIIRFAVHSLKHHNPKTFDVLMQDLFSGSLSSELTVNLHCKY